MRRSRFPDFEAVRDQLAGPVFRYFLGRCRNHADAEDLTQQVFVIVFQHLSELQHPRALRSWVFQIAQREWLAFQARRQLPTVPVELADADRRLGLPQTDPWSGFLDALSAYEALWKLDERAQEAILLVKLGGLTSREAGEVLGEPEGTVRWRVYEGLRQCRASLDEQPRGSSDAKAEGDPKPKGQS